MMRGLHAAAAGLAAAVVVVGLANPPAWWGGDRIIWGDWCDLSPTVDGGRGIWGDRWTDRGIRGGGTLEGDSGGPDGR
jgi:hypothetical protein